MRYSFLRTPNLVICTFREGRACKRYFENEQGISIIFASVCKESSRVRRKEEPQNYR